MHKTILSLFLVMLLLASCGSPSDSSDNNADTKESIENDTPKEESKYAVEIKDFMLCADYEGKQTIVINYTFTNNSDEDASAMFTLLVKAFQDGVELSRAIVVNVEGFSSDNEMKTIKPGASIDVQNAFILDSETSNVLVEITEVLAYNGGNLATKDFSII